MKHLVLIFGLVLLSCSCVKKVQGTLDSKDSFSLNGRNGSIELHRGIYAGTLKLKKKKKFVLDLIIGGTRKKADFIVPRGIKIPRHGGRLRLKAREIEQPIDLAADVITNKNPTDLRYSTSGCERTVNKNVCRERTVQGSCEINESGRRICTPTRTVQDCRLVRRVMYGTRVITFRNVNEVTSFNFALLSPEDQKVLATFKGEEVDTEREVLDYGPCRVRNIQSVTRPY